MKEKSKGPVPRTRELQLKFYVTVEELSLIKKRAQSFKNVSEYLRKISTTGKVVTPHPATDRETLIELSRIGNNINQLAHRVNQSDTNIFQKAIRRELTESLKAVSDLLESKITGLDNHIYGK